MPNYANYDMWIKGRPGNIHKMLQWMEADYNYEKESPCYIHREKKDIPVEHHLGFHTYVEYSEEDITAYENSPKFRDKDISYTVSGDVHWSLACAWFRKFECVDLAVIPDDIYPDDFKVCSRAISISEACRKLSLMIEVFSLEPGMGFSEHIIIEKDGTISENEADNGIRMYPISDIKTYEDFVKMYPDLDNSKDLWDAAESLDLDAITVGKHFDDECGWRWDRF